MQIMAENKIFFFFLQQLGICSDENSLFER